MEAMPYMKSSDHNAAAFTLLTPSAPPWKYELASVIRQAAMPPAALALASAWNWAGNFPPGWVEASRPDTDAMVLSPT